MPSESAPRVRVMLTESQQRARVRSLAYAALVSVALACVLVAVAVRADGPVAWLAWFAAVVPTTIAVLAARTAMVLRRLRAPTTPVPQRREPRKRSGGPLPVNLGRVERQAESAGQTADAHPPVDPG